MEYLTTPEFPKFCDEKAMKTCDFINEFEKQMGKELTEEQMSTLIKLAKELISSAETEITVVTFLLHQLENRLS